MPHDNVRQITVPALPEELHQVTAVHDGKIGLKALSGVSNKSTLMCKTSI
jgi:hypothetical protein